VEDLGVSVTMEKFLSDGGHGRNQPIADDVCSCQPPVDILLHQIDRRFRFV